MIGIRVTTTTIRSLVETLAHTAWKNGRITKSQLLSINGQNG